MSESTSAIRVYYWAEYFPCGPKSSCCGPSGQSEDTVRGYVERLQSAFPGVDIETIDASKDLDPSRDAAVIKLHASFGDKAFPVFAVGGEVVSVGSAEIDEVIEELRTAMGSLQDEAAGAN